MDVTIFRFIGESVNNASNAFVMPAVTTLVDALRGFGLSGLTIYVILFGMLVALGLVQAPTGRMVVLALKFAAITGVALSVSVYDSVVISTFAALENDLISAIGGETGAGLYASLDNSVSTGFGLASEAMQRGSDAGWNFVDAAGWTFTAVIILVATCVISVLGGAAIIGAKLIFTVGISLGPLFILLLMWPITARFFDSWMSAMLNTVFVVVITASILSMSMIMFNAMIEGADLTGDGVTNPIFVTGQVIILAVFIVYAINQGLGLAASVSGGLSLAAVSLAGLVAPYAAAKLGATRLIAGRQTTRRDLESGMLVTARANNHRLAGNTLMNSAYRQHIVGQSFKNWGRKAGGGIKPIKQINPEVNTNAKR